MVGSTDTIHQTQVLAALFSPAFPIGAFSYSHGIEVAIASGDVADASTAYDWIETILRGGSGRNDAILMANAYKAVDLRAIKGADLTGGRNAEIEVINELASSFITSISAFLPPVKSAPLMARRSTALYAFAIKIASLRPLPPRRIVSIQSYAVEASATSPEAIATSIPCE